jgi:hypothetical protein
MARNLLLREAAECHSRNIVNALDSKGAVLTKQGFGWCAGLEIARARQAARANRRQLRGCTTARFAIKVEIKRAVKRTGFK